MLIGYHVEHEHAGHLVKRVGKRLLRLRDRIPEDMPLPGRWDGLVLRNRSLVREKRGERFEDLRRMMGDTKRRTGRKVAVVRSVERTGERSQQRDRIVVGGTKEGCVFLQN